VIIVDWLRKLWEQHQENNKRRELYDRLDRNAAGRFSQKKYIRQLNKTVKTERKKKHDKQDDLK
jgi:hypothetical protein